MAEEAHIRPESPGDLAACVHDQLVAACPECRESWEDLGPLLRDVVRHQLATALPPPLEPSKLEIDELSGAPAVIARLLARTRELRHLRRTAKKELSELRNLPAARRLSKVRHAYRRFRSRQLAELLLEESRSAVRDSPSEAESFAALVPLVLHWTRGDANLPWAAPLLARAAAHRANALRVGGDLIAADRSVADLHRFVSAHQVSDVTTYAELASLEASLRIDQHRFEHADDLLWRASIAFQDTDDRAGQLRVGIKRANLMLDLDRPEEAIAFFEDAESLDVDTTPYLTVCLIGGRANALCDLDRPSEAGELLNKHLDAFEAVEGPYAAAVLRGIKGRVALGLGEYSVAEECFESSCTAMLATHRAFDAALSGLYLAETYYLQGKLQEVRELAGRLIVEFDSRGIPAETLQALKLLTRAAAVGELTSALLSQLRGKLAGTSTLRPPLLT